MISSRYIEPIDDIVRCRGRRWLLLAVSAVAISGLFAILIALARVPALGTLFPGAEFYRVALVLHVNLSQGVWFMAFASMLWSLGAPRESDFVERLSWTFAAGGAAGIAFSVATGETRPLMSNYLPVLDNSVFFTALVFFGAGIFLKSLSATAGFLSCTVPGGGFAERWPLALSSTASIAFFVLLAMTWLGINDAQDLLYFEALFWGAGHLWQFSLVILLMFCWLELAPKAAAKIPVSIRRFLFLGAFMPVVLALGVPLFYGPETAGYTYVYTWLMRWTSWEIPLLLGLSLLFLGRGSSALPGFGLSFLLFVTGLILGALINGQTTLVTAHYHGTIGAITLAFMAVSFQLLPLLGIEPPSVALVRAQLAFYGYGVQLMMLGLAGAGLMGAPRKTPGDLALNLSVETISRICLGLGGLCATIGIVMFAYLLIHRLFLPAGKEAFSS